MSSIKLFLLRIVFSCAFACVCATVAANEAGGSLTLSQAINETFERNPELQLFALQKEQVSGQVQIAELSPPLELSLEVENFAGSGEMKGFDAAETTIALSSVIELGDKRQLRTVTANSRMKTLQLEQQATALNLLAQTTQRFIQVVSAQQTVELVSNSVELAEQTLESVERRVNAGATTRIELLRAQAALANEQTRLLQANNLQQIARLRLAAVWGETDVNFDRAEGDLFVVGEAVDTEALQQQLNNNPELLLASSKAQLQAAELQQAQSLASPDLRWTLGARHFQATDDNALVAGISLPLFSSSRNNGRAQSADAALNESRVNQQLALLTMQSHLLELAQLHDSSLQQVTALQQNIIPKLTEALAEASNAYDRGRYSYIEMVAARQELIEAEQQLIDASTEALLVRTEIEKITAVDLPSVDSRLNQTAESDAGEQESR